MSILSILKKLVTNIADRKSRKMLIVLREEPDSLAVAAGCYVDSSDKKEKKTVVWISLLPMQ